MVRKAALPIALSLAFAVSALGQPKNPPGLVQLLVQSRIGVPDSEVVSTLSVHNAKRLRQIPQINVHVLSVPQPFAESTRQSLLKTGLFTFAEADQVGHTHMTPNDPDFSAQWHLPAIQAPTAWNTTTGGSIIAVVDTGVDPTQPDLIPNLLPGWSFVNGNSNTADTLGHGTAVAGTAAAMGNNGIGVASVSWGSKILPVVVVDSTDSATYSNIASGITYAADQGARIINLSIGGPTPSSTLQSAVTYAWNKGAVVIAAAGNSGNSTPNYPAACDNVVAVSATNSANVIASWSTFGSWIDLSAPGDTITTTNMGGGYGAWSGTSFSSPVVAGVAALVLGVQPAMSNSSVVSVLEQTATDLGAPGFDQYYGWGMVNAAAAVQAAMSSTGGDKTPPTASFTSPGPGATVSGTVNVMGSATDNVGVTRIELYIDSQLVNSASGGAISYSWNTSGATNGSHTLTLKAYDAANNVGTASNTVTVNNIIINSTIPPTVTITSPANGSVISGRSTQIRVSATDNVGVAQVSIYINGTQVYSGTAAPYTYNWNTRRLAPGTYTISATAWDKAGNSASTSVIVQH